MSSAAAVLARYAQGVLGSPLPLRIRAWDGSEVGPADAHVLVLRSRRVLRRLLWQPGELGLIRAWVAGELTIEGDLYEALSWLAGVVWERADRPGRQRSLRRAAAVLRGLVVTERPTELLGLLNGLPLPLPRPGEEAPRRSGRAAQVRDRERALISQQQDLGSDFYRLLLGPSLVYSCAYWDMASAQSSSLEQAQHENLDLVCRKLALCPGARLLDVECGWGSMAVHAARSYGAHVTAVTASAEQAIVARRRVAEAGLADRIVVRVQDYREITDGPYDAISSIGMAEYGGAEAYRAYARRLHGLLRPGGRLLNHQVASQPPRYAEACTLNNFVNRYLFPDGELMPVDSTVSLLSEAGLEIRDLEALREHQALTLRAWVANLERHWQEAVRLVGPGRARVWRLYLAASALGFEHNTLGVNQILAVRPTPEGHSCRPLITRRPVTTRPTGTTELLTGGPHR